MSAAKPQDRRAWRLALLLVAVACGAAAAAGIPVRGSYGAQVTGDEPHYLMTALSLAEDGNLDVSDELRAGRYRAFHEANLDVQSKPLSGGRHVEPHDPLLPAGLAIPMAVGGWVAAKVALAAVAGALGAALMWVAVRRFDVPPRPALVTVLVFGLSAPLAVYGNQIYPELPAALAVTLAIAALTGPLRGRGAVMLAASLVALPWLSVKYAPVAAALAVVGLARLMRSGKRMHALGLCVVLSAAAAHFLVAHQIWYGGFTPYATGEHFTEGELSVVGFDPDYLGRARRLIGLLIDDKFGLAAWQPAWLLAVPALAVLARRRPRGWDALAVPLAAGWIIATFVALTMHGWWWPGRQVVVVLPALVLAIAWWARNGGARMTAVVGAGAIGVVSYAWIVIEGIGRDVTWVVDFFETSNPLYRVWQAALPDYPSVTPTTWLLHGLWLIAGAAAVAGWLGVGRLGRGRFGRGAGTDRRPRAAARVCSRARRSTDSAHSAAVVIAARAERENRRHRRRDQRSRDPHDSPFL